MSDTTDALEAELRATEIPLAVLSRGNEPPVGTWVRDRHGAVSYRQKGGGWGEPGIMPFGVWTAMWDARGPYVLCGPWGAPTPAESVLSRAADALAAARTENERLTTEVTYLRGTQGGYEAALCAAHRREDKRIAQRDAARAALAEANRKIEAALALIPIDNPELIEYGYGVDAGDLLAALSTTPKKPNEGNTCCLRP